MGDKVNERSVFNEEEILRIHSCLISLYFILKRKYGEDIDNQIEEYTQKANLPTNSSLVKPSKFEILGMCHRNMDKFENNTLENDIAYLILLYAFYNSNSVAIGYDKTEIIEFEQNWESVLSCVCEKFGVKNNMNENYNQTELVLAFLYLYVYIILQNEGLIQGNLDFWSSNSTNILIYLPLEGMVNLGYFQYLINNNKAMFSKEVPFNNNLTNGLTISYNEEEIATIQITQFDCGFISQSNCKVPVKYAQLVELVSMLKDGKKYLTQLQVYDYNNYKNLLEVSTDWLCLFHVLIGKTKARTEEFKLKKVLYDTSCHFSHTDEFPTEKFNCCRILAKVDECNYEVRGIIYPNLYGKVITCVKSIIFRELPLETIHKLENMHNIVMSHLGTFVSALSDILIDKQIDMKDKQAYCNTVKKALENHDLSHIKTDCKFKNNVLVQLVSWLFISEIYAYLKTELVICEYLKNNNSIIRNCYGFYPNLISEHCQVYLENLAVVHQKIITKKIDGRIIPIRFDIVNEELEMFYKKHKVFHNEDISDLINKTKSAIMRFFGDTHIEQSRKCCTLRQFMTVSLLIVKHQKGSNSLSNVPEFKYYNSKKRNLSVRTLLTDPNIECMYKDIAFASKIMEYQNHAFIGTSHLDWYNDLVIIAYKKITDYFEEQIPIIKTGSIKKAKKEDAQLANKLTPYELLMSVYDITINLFDKLLDEMP